MGSFYVEPLTCSFADLYWKMDIPTVKHSEIQEVSIEMIGNEPALFTFLPENGAIFLNDAQKVDFMNGI